MSTRAAGAVTALLVLVIGLVVGLLPHSIDIGLATQQTQSCGSAFSPKSADDLKVTQAMVEMTNAISGTDGTTQQTVAQQCSDAVSTPRTIAFVLIGLGALAGLFLLMTAPKRTEVPATP